MKKPKKRTYKRRKPIERPSIDIQASVDRATERVAYDIAERHRQWHTELGRLEAAVKRVEEIEAASVRLLSILWPPKQ